MPLIPADNHMAVMAALAVIAAAAFALERTRIGANLTAAVIAILGAIAAANLGVIPNSAPAYGFVFKYVVPLLIPLFLFSADLGRLVTEAGRMTLAFALAAAGTVAGVTVALLALDLSHLGGLSGLGQAAREPAIAGLFAATYIGGSVNFAAIGELTGLARDGGFFAAAIAADHLLGALYLSLIALMPAWGWLVRRFTAHAAPAMPAKPDRAQGGPAIGAASIGMSLAAAMVMVATGDAIVAWLGIGDWRYVVITTLTLAFATTFPGAARRLAGSFELGIAFSLIFFAAIAAGADIRAMLATAPLLAVMVAILLVVHALITFGLGARMKFTLPELVTASNAAILGATTAPALAAAKGWRDLVMPGVLVGVFGYAVGTYVGTVMFKYWHVLL